MGKSLSSVFLTQISRDQDPIFHLTHQFTKLKMLHTNKHVTRKYFQYLHRFY